MNGISSTLKDEIKKTQTHKQKEKFKFIAAILATNLMVAVLCLPSKQVTPTPELPVKKMHDDYQLMSIPLTLLISESSHELAEIPITLVSKDKKIIAEKAYLHKSAGSRNDSPHFKIEIKNSDVVRVSEFAEEGMVAVPYVEIKRNKLQKTRGSRYEVSI